MPLAKHRQVTLCEQVILVYITSSRTARENLSMDPHHPHKRLGFTAYTCNPRTLGRSRWLLGTHWPAHLQNCKPCCRAFICVDIPRLLIKKFNLDWGQSQWLADQNQPQKFWRTQNTYGEIEEIVERGLERLKAFLDQEKRSLVTSTTSLTNQFLSQYLTPELY